MVHVVVVAAVEKDLGLEPRRIRDGERCWSAVV
jgi:hypothetical protein